MAHGTGIRIQVHNQDAHEHDDVFLVENHTALEVDNFSLFGKDMDETDMFDVTFNAGNASIEDD